MASDITQWVHHRPRKKPRSELPSERPRLQFEIDDRIDRSLVTAHAGVPLVLELFRRVGAAQVVNDQVRIKQRQRGIGHAISADMSPLLQAEIMLLSECAWQPDRDEPDVIREGAEVPYVPEDGDHRKDRPCVRPVSGRAGPGSEQSCGTPPA